MSIGLGAVLFKNIVNFLGGQNPVQTFEKVHRRLQFRLEVKYSAFMASTPLSLLKLVQYSCLCAEGAKNG